MEQLLKKLKNAPVIKTEESEEERLKYLEQTGLNDIVNKGLVELYRVQPENPVTFLASFLINEDNAKKIIESIKNAKKTKVTLEQKQKEKEEFNQKMLEESRKKEEEKEQEKEKLREEIKSCEDFEDKLNDICEKLKNITGATGVYISSYEYKRKQIENITDDENAHIDPDNIKVLRYIHWNEDHNFLHGKYLPRKKGVTYSIFLNGEEGDDEDEGGEGGGEGGEEAKEAPPQENAGGGNEEDEEEDNEEQNKDLPVKMMEIQDVVNTKKMHFYREPRLGSYLFFDIGYKSSLNYNSLLSAIKNLQEYQQQNEEYEKAKAEKEEEERQKAAAKEEEQQNNEGGAEVEEEEDKKDGGDGEGVRTR